MNYLKELCKRWYVIVCCAMICAGALYVEKTIVYPSIPASGDYLFIRLLQFTDIPMLGDRKMGNEVDVSNGMRTLPQKARLAKDLAQQFDMQRVDASWEKMPESYKLAWVDNHFKINRVEPGIYELSIHFTKKDAKDGEYVKDNEEHFMELFTKHFKSTASLFVENTELKELDRYSLIDEAFSTDQTHIIAKYVVIGLILGSMAGIVLITAWLSKRGII